MFSDFYISTVKCFVSFHKTCCNASDNQCCNTHQDNGSANFHSFLCFCFLFLFLTSFFHLKVIFCHDFLCFSFCSCHFFIFSFRHNCLLLFVKCFYSISENCVIFVNFYLDFNSSACSLKLLTISDTSSTNLLFSSHA